MTQANLSPSLTETSSDQRMRGAIQALAKIARHGGGLNVDKARKAGLEEHANQLLKLGLIRTVVTAIGSAYQITESGSRFLEQYEELERDAIRSMIDSEENRVQHSKDEVTVVIPTLNEAEGITRVIAETKAEGYRNILVVDGYSSDQTPKIAGANGAEVVYQHGSGKAGAVRTAIERARTPYVLFMDGDHTYDPKDIWRLIAHSDNYAQVIGTRERRSIPHLHRFGNWVISQLFSLLFMVKVTDVCSGMYLLRTEEARKYTLQESGFIAEVELAAQSASMGSLTEAAISYRPRIGTQKLSTWRHGLAILSAVVVLLRRHNPILLYSALTGLSLIPAVLILGWVGWEQLTRRIWHSDWAMLSIVLLLVATHAFTLASISVLTKHMERRLLRQVKS